MDQQLLQDYAKAKENFLNAKKRIQEIEGFYGIGYSTVHSKFFTRFTGRLKYNSFQSWLDYEDKLATRRRRELKLAQDKINDAYALFVPYRDRILQLQYSQITNEMRQDTLKKNLENMNRNLTSLRDECTTLDSLETYPKIIDSLLGEFKPENPYGNHLEKNYKSWEKSNRRAVKELGSLIASIVEDS